VSELERETAAPAPGATFAAWRQPLRSLAAAVQGAVRGRLLSALAARDLGALGRGVAEGAGDTTFALDLPAEAAVEAWFVEQARSGPLSLLTEDAGWRHRGPDPAQPKGWRALEGFDHGGPRIVIDPIDGTRPLMHDLRSAWTVIGFAGAGSGQPLGSELSGGLLVELPPSVQDRARWLEAPRGGPVELRTLPVRVSAEEVAGAAVTQVRADEDDRVDAGYLSFFRYHPAQRRRIACLEESFFRRLAEEEGADLRQVYEDAYCSSGAQLALLALGRYRFVADLRARVGVVPGPTCKAYDIAGAVVVAEAAGVVLRDAFGAELDFGIDVTTPVDWVGYVNEATRARLAPHLAGAWAELEES
jgi:fructose-1,6-bisphosphatase/inositol monophosphatase family enzyme